MSANRNSEAASLVSGLPTGSGAAAILAAGAGCFLLAVISIATDRIPALGRWMSFYRPTGPLSGVTTLAILAWLAIWIVLDRKWCHRNLNMRPVVIAAIVLLGLGLLLTFPPVADLF
ncbi:MAG TPA: hypothetical protein VFN62_00075 [Acidobacteriaceae bacterium]|nr:hypothetical protein [Acidobacteriaceae bacterium]